MAGTALKRLMAEYKRESSPETMADMKYCSVNTHTHVLSIPP